MTLKELIQKKSQRLEDIPEDFLTELQKLEQGTFNRVIELLNRLEVRGGAFIPNAENLRIVSEITDELRGAMATPEFNQTVANFAREFDTQTALANQYFTQIITSFEVTDFYASVARAGKRNAVEALLSGIDTNFVKPLQNVMEQAVINNSTYQETLSMIQEVILGGEDIEPRYLRYASTWARETYSVADRSYSSAVADDLDLEWFLYTSGSVRDSRKFCVQRNGKFFHRKEVEMWGDGKSTPNYALESPGVEPYWQGFRRGTNSKTIFTYLGGWNCMHSILGTSITIVPKADIDRAIKLGYFTPTKVEQQFLTNKYG